MASNLFKAVRAINRLSVGARQACRQDHWFTKYREPPNGFMFNLKPRKPGEKISERWEYWEPPLYAALTVGVTTIYFMAYFSPVPLTMERWYEEEAARRVAENDAAEAAAKANV